MNLDSNRPQLMRLNREFGRYMSKDKINWIYYMTTVSSILHNHWKCLKRLFWLLFFSDWWHMTWLSSATVSYKDEKKWMFAAPRTGTSMNQIWRVWCIIMWGNFSGWLLHLFMDKNSIVHLFLRTVYTSNLFWKALHRQWSTSVSIWLDCES